MLIKINKGTKNARPVLPKDVPCLALTPSGQSVVLIVLETGGVVYRAVNLTTGKACFNGRDEENLKTFTYIDDGTTVTLSNI